MTQSFYVMEDNLEILLGRSAELQELLHGLLVQEPLEKSERNTASRILCAIVFEHADSVRILSTTMNFTSALGLARLQYEALVRAVWLHFAAADSVVSKLMAELTQENARKANQLPLLSEMLMALEGKAPAEALGPLLEFRDYSWKPLSSFVHGGIHVIQRHGKGYPVSLLTQTIRASNALLVMSAELLIVLLGDKNHLGTLPRLQHEFADCMPELKKTSL